MQSTFRRLSEPSAASRMFLASILERERESSEFP